MGCCGSKVPEFDLVTNRTLHELGLSKSEVKKLHRQFLHLDTRRTGVVQAAEFFDFFDLQPSLVNKLLFSCYDLEENGEMTFIQFVCTLWSFFTVAPEQLGGFVFFVFDLKKNGEMSFSEVPGVVRGLHRKHYDETPSLQGQVAALLQEQAGAKGPQLLGAEAFAAWTAAHPDLCRPMLGKQVDMIDKALRASFWKGLRLRRTKVARLRDVYHVRRFMRKVLGHREDPKKPPTPAEQAEQARLEVIAAEVQKVAVFKAEKAAKKKKEYVAKVQAGTGQQASYFNVEDIDQLMDRFTTGLDETAGGELKKKGGGGNKGGGKSGKKSGGRKGKKVAGMDHSAGSASTGTKALPPLVLKALQKGTLSSAAIAPMDNCRISEAARSKVQRDRESEMSPEERRRVHAARAAKYNRAASNEHNLFS